MPELHMEKHGDSWFPADEDSSAYVRTSWTNTDLDTLRGLLEDLVDVPAGYRLDLLELRDWYKNGKQLPMFGLVKKRGRPSGRWATKRTKLSEAEYDLLVDLRASNCTAAELREYLAKLRAAEK